MTPPGARDNPVSLGAILHEKRAAGRAALWTGSGLAVPPALEHALEALLERLEAESGAPIVLTALGNTEPGLNPFAGLGDGAAPEPDGEHAAQLVALLGPGTCHEWNRWPPHVALLSPAALDILDHEPVGLVVSDLQMEPMDGATLLGKIRELGVL